MGFEGDETPLMTDQPARSKSARELRDIRLLWLLGYSIPQIAARLGRHRGTIWKRIKTHGLDSPEEPLERARLTLECAHDRLADEMLARGDPDADIGPLIRLAGELRRLDSARRTRARAETHQPEQEEDSEEDVSRQLAALADRLEEKAQGENERGRSEAAGAKTPCGQPVAAHGPRYAGSAAGPLADMCVHGRTRRWQDPGWG